MRFALGFVVLAAGAGVAWAWTPIDPSRPVWTPPVPYAMQQAGSADLGPSASAVLVRRAFEDWTRVSCTGLRASYQGLSNVGPSRSADGRSVVGWVESAWPFDPTSIGVTAPRWTTRIVEADMHLNGVNYTWIDGPGRGSQVDAYSILLHESGHYYGLGHSSDRAAAMFAAYPGGSVPMGPDDRVGICALYPGSNDCTVSGCPTGMQCQNGSCVTVMGSGGICSPCSTGGQCSSGGSCLRYPDGNGYCGKACTTAADCGGDSCVSVSGMGQCVRLSGGVFDCSGNGTPACSLDSDCPDSQICSGTPAACRAPGPGAALGSPCTTMAECASAICFQNRCARTCDWLRPASCPASYYCADQGVGVCAAGFCLAGSPGSGQVGSRCARDTDCQGLLCVGGSCHLPCQPGMAAGCGGGASCERGVAPSCGVCSTSGTGDGGAGDGSAVDGGDGGGDDGGCGCQVAGRSARPRGGLLASVLLGLLVLALRRRRGVGVLALLGALLLAGCGGDSSDAVDAAVDVGDGGTPLTTCAQAAGVDLLFVIDNSNSMREEQTSLAAELPTLVGSLVSPPDDDRDGKPDWLPIKDLQVGVVTTDMGTGGFATPTCSAPAFGDDGRLRTIGRVDLAGCAASYPPVLRHDPATQTAAQFAHDVACVAQAGVGGCGFEQQLEAALKALAPARATSYTGPGYVAPSFFRSSTGHGDGANAGLVRDDTLLAVVIVSDEEDCSTSDPALYDNASPIYGMTPSNLRCFAHADRALHPIQRYVAELRSLRAARPDLFTLALVVGIPVDLAANDPTDADFAAILGDPRMAERVDPMMPNRLVPSCDVAGRGVAFPPRRMVSAARALAPGTTTIQSICQASFRPALQAIARLAGRRACHRFSD